MKKKSRTPVKLNKKALIDDLSQYRPLQKFIDQLIFQKLKYTIRNFCSNMNPDMLQAISPRLSRLAYSSSKVIQIKFKLLGTHWPPQIIYSSNLAEYKVIGFNFREMDALSEWRLLFTDRVIHLNPNKALKYR